jgi:hypothetical protein
MDSLGDGSDWGETRIWAARRELALPTDVVWVRDAFLDHLVPSVPRSLVETRVLFHLRSTFSGGLFQGGLVNVVCRAGAEGYKQ